MDGSTRSSSSSCFPMSPSRWRLPCFRGAKVVATDQVVAVPLPAAATAGKRLSAKAGVARGLKVILSGLVDEAGKRFDRSIPAVRFGHVAYIR